MDNNGDGNGRRTLRKKFGSTLGEHKHALEYALLEYILQGYNAASISRKMRKEFADVDGIDEAKILHLLKSAIENQVIQLHTTRLHELEDQLRAAYRADHGFDIAFCIVDDTIGFKNAHSMSSFFWSKAADMIIERIGDILDRTPPSEEVVIGSTGGPSVSEAIKHLSRLSFDPHFVDSNRHRLWFLSLTAAGSPYNFDMHSNYLAALLAQTYRCRHMAVINLDPVVTEKVRQDYDKKVANMQMLIGGVGAKNGFLMEWFKSHNVPPPKDMIGDLFFHPIGPDGSLLRLSKEEAKVLAPLQIRPLREPMEKFHRRDVKTHTLAVVTEGWVKDKRVDKSGVLDVVLRHGHLTDCVIGSHLAKRLLERRIGKKAGPFSQNKREQKGFAA